MFIFDSSLSTAVSSPEPAAGHPSSAHPAAVAGPLSADLLDRMNRYWQAANYLTVGQIYLQANPLLREPLRLEHIKPRFAGPLGNLARPQLYVCAFESPDPGNEGLRSFHRGARPRRPGAQCPFVSGRNVHGRPSGSYAGHCRRTAILPRILDAWRRAEPLRSALAKLHS